MMGDKVLSYSNNILTLRNLPVISIVSPSIVIHANLSSRHCRLAPLRAVSPYSDHTHHES